MHLVGSSTHCNMMHGAYNVILWDKIYQRKFFEFSSLRFAVTFQQTIREAMFLEKHSRIYDIIQCGGPFCWKCLKFSVINKFIKLSLRTPLISVDPNFWRNGMTGSYIYCRETWPESVHSSSEQWLNTCLGVRLEFEWPTHYLKFVTCIQEMLGSNLGQDTVYPNYKIFVNFLVPFSIEILKLYLIVSECSTLYNSTINGKLVTV